MSGTAGSILSAVYGYDMLPVKRLVLSAVFYREAVYPLAPVTDPVRA